MRHLLLRAGLSDRVEVDSAGTGDWHLGQPPCDRAVRHAAARGYALTGRSRQVTAADFRRFDRIIALDRQNLADLRALAPVDATARLGLLRDHDPGAGGPQDVPDPYYGGEAGFELVLDIVERSCAALLDEVRAG